MTANDTDSPADDLCAGSGQALFRPGPQFGLRRCRARRPSDREDWPTAEGTRSRLGADARQGIAAEGCLVTHRVNEAAPAGEKKTPATLKRAGVTKKTTCLQM